MAEQPSVVDARRPYRWNDEFPIVTEAGPELKASIRKKWPELCELATTGLRHRPTGGSFRFPGP